MLCRGIGHNFVMQEKKAQSRPDYSDLFQCERPQFDPSRKMSLKERAAQFSPFSALRGFDEEIEESSRRTESRPELSQQECDKLNARLQFLAEQSANRPTIQITRFVQDTKKSGGALVTEVVCVKRVDWVKRTIFLSNRTERSFDDIVSIQGKLFEAMPGDDFL